LTTTKKKLLIVIPIIVVAGIIGTVVFSYLGNTTNQGPFLRSPYNKSLKIELVAEGLSSPTSMAFVGNNNEDILVLEKDKGTVRVISNGSLKEEAVLKVNVSSKGEQGLLGIATINNNNNYYNYNDNTKHSSSNNNDGDSVFLYYTQAYPLRNRIYKYQWNENTLVNSKLVFDLPAEPGPYHQGGKLKIGPDKKFLYAVIGDLNAPNSKLQNYKYGRESNPTSVILKINVDNILSSIDTNYDNIFSFTDNNTNAVEKLSNKYYYYYAYGIRNSFGMDFDPITGFLWDTENGEDKYDEINLVKPGFNSGWIQVMGPISRNSDKTQEDMVNFPGSKYADPAFSWKYQIGITDIEFLNSSKLGDKYTNNIFVGDINYGNLYYFGINDSRTGIKLDYRLTSSGLNDLVADNNRESSQVIFGTGFGRITDIETGPDGFLYILSYEDGKIYRILPS
jgi:glucose/arabinose dehydrogenase